MYAVPTFAEPELGPMLSVAEFGLLSVAAINLVLLASTISNVSALILAIDNVLSFAFNLTFLPASAALPSLARTLPFDVLTSELISRPAVLLFTPVNAISISLSAFTVCIDYTVRSVCFNITV